MPTREQIINEAIKLSETIEDIDNSNLLNIWLGIYSTLLWYEPVNWVGFIDLPHIIDADKLRPSTFSKKSAWKKPKIWQQRAHAVSLYLAKQLNCSIDELPLKTDLLMKQPDYIDMQRQNILGIAFIGLVKHVLEKFGGEDISYETEVEAATIFPGITFPGRSGTPRIDLLLKRDRIPVGIISSKWSLRHDRLNDITNECPIYSAAYERIYRGQSQSHLRYYVVTNEFDPSRLNKILDDTCINGVVHVHKNAVINVCGLDGRISRVIDLADFINQTSSW